MDDTQKILKRGNLSLHTPGGFFKKRWHGKYLVLYDGSKSGVKRLELFDSEIKFKKQNPAKIIPLIDCVRVVTCQRQKSTYTFEVRTNDQFYLLAAQTFQDMNDWVNCLRLVAFGQQQAASQMTQPVKKQQVTDSAPPNVATRTGGANGFSPASRNPVDILLEQSKRNQSVASALGGGSGQPKGAGTSGQPSQESQPLTASQAAAAAASALAKTRQRQPSLLGSCKPQPPNDSPFIQQTKQLEHRAATNAVILNAVGQLDTLTPTVRGQLISGRSLGQPAGGVSSAQRQATNFQASKLAQLPSKLNKLDEEEENMLYCSIEDNPSEHNYRVKVIETELSLRCQLKCYQLTAPLTISQQYEQLGRFNQVTGQYELASTGEQQQQQQPQVVTFYQLIIGPQELTLLNDYANSVQPSGALHLKQQQGLWSWPYQCIRRYGFDKDNCFMFEAGRKCGSGPGQFIVQTPKAYNIYQDVVKFVNELRSVSASNSGSAGQIVAQDNQNLAQNFGAGDPAKGPVVTQIPVTWAPVAPAAQPVAATAGTVPVSAPASNSSVAEQDTRKQFFNALKQLDQVGPSQPTERSQEIVSNQKRAHSGALARAESGREFGAELTGERAQAEGPEAGKKAIVSSSPEETDESGYEQGDESVDGSTNKFKLGASTRRRPNLNLSSTESMSSSSSTASSQGLGANCERTRGPSKPPVKPDSTNTTSPKPNLSQKSISRSDLIKRSIGGLNGEPAQEDFETSLIRDVYSEITKLHAKFAVTNNSPDDSISSHSSNELNSVEADRSSSASSSSGDQNEDYQQVISQRGEPMYSNLRPTNVGKVPARISNLNSNLNDNFEEHNRLFKAKLSQQHYSAQNDCFDSFARQQANLGSPIYPTILNPIPECGEFPAPTKQLPKLAPKPAAGYLLQANKNLQAKRQLNTKQSGSKLDRQTNHYLINDVQYAKISRNNLKSDFESFL